MPRNCCGWGSASMDVPLHVKESKRSSVDTNPNKGARLLPTKAASNAIVRQQNLGSRSKKLSGLWWGLTADQRKDWVTVESGRDEKNHITLGKTPEWFTAYAKVVRDEGYVKLGERPKATAQKTVPGASALRIKKRRSVENARFASAYVKFGYLARPLLSPPYLPGTTGKERMSVMSAFQGGIWRALTPSEQKSFETVEIGLTKEFDWKIDGRNSEVEEILAGIGDREPAEISVKGQRKRKRKRKCKRERQKVSPE